LLMFVVNVVSLATFCAVSDVVASRNRKSMYFIVLNLVD